MLRRLEKDTGSLAGIGRHAALHLSSHTVIATGRRSGIIGITASQCSIRFRSELSRNAAMVEHLLGDVSHRGARVGLHQELEPR